MGYAWKVHLYAGPRRLCDFVQKIVVEDRIESDHMPVELYCNFYTDPDSYVRENAQEKRKKYFGVKTK